MKKNHTIWMFLILIGVSLPQIAGACPSCFGESDSPLAEGMNAGIFVLLGVVGFVLTGLAAFGIFLARRSGYLMAEAETDAVVEIQSGATAVERDVIEKS